MIREYVIEYAEDRIGIGMIENRRKGGGGRAWEWAGIVRGYVGVESSRMWAWKVRGKFEGGENSRVWLGMFEGAGIEGARVSMSLQAGLFSW